MAPAGKRKRGDRTYSQDSNDGSNRPSPHRPGNLNLAQQNQYGQHGQPQNHGRGFRRSSRGGRGGGSQPRSPASAPPAQANWQQRSNQNSHGNMSPPPPNLPSNRATAASNAVASPNASSGTSQASAPQRPIPSPSGATPRAYHYEYVTEDRISSWQTSGKASLLDAVHEAQSDGLFLSTMFQELVRAGLDGLLDPYEAGKTIKEILQSSVPDPRIDPVSLFLGCVSILTESETAKPSLKAIMFSTGIDPSRMREDLETPLLASLGLVRDTFQRIGIRKATDTLYRQSNYNLLREETEGYSKLMTEYFTTSNSGPPTGELVRETFQKVKALVGAFDLDVGRVLDVTLDVFANLLVKHYRFFIKFLRVSSWWPETAVGDKGSPRGQQCSSLPSWALPGSEAWQTSDEERKSLAAERHERDRAFWLRAREAGIGAFFELSSGGDRSGSQEPGLTNGAPTVHDRPPTRGNRTAAQLLGFKLRFYASPARDAQDTLPDNLIHLAALLIKIGFITLQDLYPHLYPQDEAMPAVKEKLMKEKAERERKNRPGGGAMNALMMAGALADDTVAPPAISRLRDAEPSRASPSKTDTASEKDGPAAKSEAEAPPLPEPVDQKVQLLKSLLCIGAIPEALFILGRFPWLMDAYPDLPEYLHRLLNHCLSKVYEPLRPLADRDTIRVGKKVVAEQAGIVKGEIRFADYQPRRVLRWANLDRNDAGDGIDYRFYWDDWADNVPVCQSVDDVFTLCGTLLNFSGVKIGQDPELLIKLARIGKKSLTDDYSETNVNRWIDLAKRLLVPALSLTKANPGVVNEVYELLKFFSARARYSIYAEWYTGQISRLPDIQTAFDIARAETKDVLKRISKTNTKPMARALAKVAYASPGIVFSVALNQIEAYENLIEVVVECARYFTYLGYDVLTWSLMSSLGGRGRDRVQADGMLTSSWLKALSLFAGRVFKRYSVMQPSPILQYVANQLRMGYSTDLEVLEQIISSMAGIRSDISFNESQTQAMAGGEILRSQTLEQLHDKRHETKQSSKRLLKSLTDPPLAGRLLIAIAQERQTYIFHASESNAPLKVLGNNLDKIHQVFIQYLEMLRSNLSVKDFDACVPDVVSLISEFGLDPSIAFAISRPSIAHTIQEANAALKNEKQDKARVSAAEKQQVAPETSTKDEHAKKNEEEGQINGGRSDKASENESSQAKESDDVEMKDANHNEESAITPISAPVHAVNGLEEPWDATLKPLIDKFKEILPTDFEDNLSLSFYITFWQLSLHDVLVPSSSYEEEIKRQRDKISAINADRTDITVIGVKRKEQKKKELNELQDRLRAEMKTQIHTYSQVRGRLQKEKDRWFTSLVPTKREALHAAILQECFLPRILLSPLDALYTFKMLFFLHSSGTPGFGTMHMIDRLFREKQLAALLFHSTAREAENLGRFFNELLKELRRWHNDLAVYEKVAYGPKRDLPGFLRKPRTENTPDVFLDFEDFRRLHYKWHRQLAVSIKACLTGGEYMHIRNAIIVLKSVHQYFPVVNWTGQHMVASVTALSKNESRGDLKLAATSLLGDLKRREKDWVLPQAFYVPDPSSGSAKAGSRAASARADTPQPNAAGSLNATAPEFKPKPSNLTNGVSKSSIPSKTEVEDGEIDDLKAENGRVKQGNVSDGKTGELAGRKEKDLVAKKEEKQSDPARSKDAGDQPAVDSVLPPPPPRNIPQKPGLPESGTKTQVKSDPVAAPSGHQSLPPPPPPTPSLSVETGRQHSTQPVSVRTPHNLPNRPEPQQPPQVKILSRSNDRAANTRGQEFHPRDYPGREYAASGNDIQVSNGPDYARLDQAGNMARDNWVGRREQSPGPRSRARTPERGGPLDKERREPGRISTKETRDYQEDWGPRNVLRDSRYGTRNASWNPPNNDRPDTQSLSLGGDPRSRNPGAPSMGPPAPVPSHAIDRMGHGGAERSDIMHHQYERSGLNPGQFDRHSSGQDRAMGTSERAAPQDRDHGRRQENMRLGRESRRDWNMPESPFRNENALAAYPFPSESSRDDPRHDRAPFTERSKANQSYGFHGQPDREDAGGIPPTGPRGERTSRMDNPDFPESGPPARSRELFQQSFQPRPPSDPNHGRLSQDYPAPPRPIPLDSSSARASSGPEIPSGPRSRNSVGRGGRNFTAPPMQANARPNEAHPQGQLSPTQLSDTNPFPGNRDRQGSGPVRVDHPAAAAAATAPAPAQSVVPPSPSAEPSPSGLAGIHPSRLNQIQPTPSVAEAQVPPLNPPPSSSASMPPSGPRGVTRGGPGTPTLSPSSRFPPSTQPPVPERRTEDKRFAGIQNMLQQGASRNLQDRGDRGASIRGRAGRNGNAVGVSSPINSQPSTPNINRPDTLPARPDMSTLEPLPSRVQALQEINSQEERYDGRSDRREGRREGERRSGRLRQSRSQSRDTDRDGSRRVDEHGMRSEEYRERRVGSDREGRDGRRPREDMRDRDRERDRERRDGRLRNDDATRREGFTARDEVARRSGMPPEQQQQAQNMNWDNRHSDGRARGSDKRDERDWRERRDGREGRDRGEFRKRGRMGDDSSYGESKRPRRGNQ